MARAYVTIEQPEWFQLAADDANFGVAEVMQVFRYKTPAGVYNGVKMGKFPPHSIEVMGRNNQPRKRWTKAVLVAEINRRKGNG